MDPPTDSTSKTFVLVHGASHGGGCYDRVADLLRAQGHRVFTPTLLGLAERFPENWTRRIDLTDHVDDVVGLFEREGLRDVFLCGHSYGGMVISGVAERVPDRIHNLVFIDAVVPDDGKRMTDYVFPGWRIVPVMAAVGILGRSRTCIAPPASYFRVNKADQAMVNRKMTPHPFASLRERIRLTGKANRVPHHTYVYATEWGFAPITQQFERAKARDGWEVFEVAAGHDIMIDAPHELAGILGRNA